MKNWRRRNLYKKKIQKTDFGKEFSFYKWKKKNLYNNYHYYLCLPSQNTVLVKKFFKKIWLDAGHS